MKQKMMMQKNRILSFFELSNNLLKDFPINGLIKYENVFSTILRHEHRKEQEVLSVKNRLLLKLPLQFF